jgi:hypothetical protein
MTRRLALAFLVVTTAGCFTPRAGSSLQESWVGGWGTSISNQVQFDHGCAVEKIRWIRSDKNHNTADLDVCGVVRRYKSVRGFGEELTWIDVTSLYPAAVLPSPLAAP